MNRLIIIGNGFDLAHGMRTSYSHFISDYLLKAVSEFHHTNKYEDPLLIIRFNRFHYHNRAVRNEITLESIWEIIDNIKNNEDVDFQPSELLSLVIKDIENYDWVDIESKYFDYLKSISKSSSYDETTIRNLNDQLSYLKNKLIEFLSKEENKYKGVSISQELLRHFTSIPLKEECIPNTKTISGSVFQYYFLNFNYTNTIEKYRDACQNFEPNKSRNAKVNYIHGSLNNKSGEPIFGFGDELDADFKGFENKNNNDLYKHIKSFKYIKNENYSNLLHFLSSDEFQVSIVGHSCGISDRTMLNEIFEHTNCRSIKIFYHERDNESNDFTDKSYEIYKHFQDKGMFRKKIVPFTKSHPIPQIERELVIEESEVLSE